jgi:hypothetical protein
MGGGAIAQGPILNTTVTLERLKKRGYVSMSKIYSEISPMLNEPPYMRSVSRCFGSGVKDSPLGLYLAAAYSINGSLLSVLYSLSIFSIIFFVVV